MSGVLVELEPSLVARSRDLLADLPALRVVEGDAGLTASASAGAPADLLMLCGVFGNVSDDDIRRTAHNASRLCAPGATAIGPLPTRIVCSTTPLSGSTRDTVPPPVFATHTAPRTRSRGVVSRVTSTAISTTT